MDQHLEYLQWRSPDLIVNEQQVGVNSSSESQSMPDEEISYIQTQWAQEISNVRVDILNSHSLSPESGMQLHSYSKNICI